MDSETKKLIRTLKTKKTSDEEIARILSISKEDVLSVRPIRFVTDEIKKEIIERYNSGESITEILKHCHFSRQTVYNIVRENCDVRNKKGRTVTPEEIAIARKLATQGEKIKTIAKLLDVPEACLYPKVRGFTSNSYSRLSKEQEKEIIKLVEQGEKRLNIAKMFDVNRSTIYRVLQRNKKAAN